MTKSEFAALHGVEYAEAAGFILFLVAKGLATHKGKIPAKGGKGKPSDVYEIPDTVNLTGLLQGKKAA